MRGWLVGAGGAALLGMGLACGGMKEPVPVPAPAPVEVDDGATGGVVVDDAALGELLDAEDPEHQLTDQARQARQAALRAFVDATPDFAEWKVAVLDTITGQDAKTTEEAYTLVKADFAPKPPQPVAVTGEPWKVVVIVSQAEDTTEDWAYYTFEVQKALEAEGIAVVWLKSGGMTAVSVQRDGKEVDTIDAKPFLDPDHTTIGYLFAMDGATPKWQEHEVSDVVVGAAHAYFAGAATEEPAPHEGGGGGGQKAGKGGKGGKAGGGGKAGKRPH